jgi:mannose-6-phosphate isomerase-like protein (cupin superfamily)
MRLLRITDLADIREGHFLAGVLPGAYLCDGGLGFKAPGLRTHTADGPGGSDRHVHPHDCEAFVLLQGRAIMEVDGKPYPLVSGDVCIIEPGEDHHLVSDRDDPCVNLWLHAGEQRHPGQAQGGTMDV